jgi:hypothetical protein
MANDKKVQGTYEMNQKLRNRLRKFMGDNNMNRFPEAALFLINEALEKRKYK